MIIQFKYILWNAIESYLAESISEADELNLSEFRTSIRSRWDHPNKLEVNPVPAKQQGNWGSPIAFKIAQLQSKFFGVEVSPLFVADSILTFVQQHAHGSYFEVALVNNGYINFSITSVGQRYFFWRVLTDPVRLYLLGDCFSDVCESGDISASSFLPLTWESIAEAVSGDLEMQAFVAPFIAGSPAEFSDFIMALAARGDPELSLVHYRDSLMGSQNVPWQFDRFFIDARKISDSEKISSEEFFRICNEVEKNPYSSHIFNVLFNVIANFRYHYFGSVLSNSPHLLLRDLRFLVLSFYKLYNRPEVRRVVNNREGNVDREVSKLMSIIANCLEIVVDEGLRKIQACCRG